MAFQPTFFSHHPSQPIAAGVPGRHNHRVFFWEAGLLCVIVLLALLLRLWHLSVLTDNYDEGVYWSSLRSMYAGNDLFTPVFSSQPPFFLLSLYPLVALLGPTLLAARLGIVILSLLGILGMYLLARRLGGPWAGLGATLLLSSDYLYLIQSQTVQAEAPSVALMIVAVAAAAYAHRYPWQAAFVAGAATALAMLEKLFAVAAIIPILALFLGYLIAFERAQRRAQGPRQHSAALARQPILQQPTLRRAAVLAGAYLGGLALAGVVVFLPYLHQLQAAYHQVVAFHLVAAQHDANTLNKNVELLLAATTEYPLAVLALLGVIVGLLRRRWQAFTAAAWIVASLVILLHQAPLFQHHLVLLVPSLILAAAVGLAPGAETFSKEVPALAAPLRGIWAAGSMPASKGVLIGLPVLLLAAMLLPNLQNAAAHPLLSNAKIAQVAKDLQRLTTPQQEVIVDDQYIADLANRAVPPALVDTSLLRLSTGYLTVQQIIAIAEQPQVDAILFYSGRFNELPGLRAWTEQHFHLARAYGKGQDLYLRAGP